MWSKNIHTAEICCCHQYSVAGPKSLDVALHLTMAGFNSMSNLGKALQSSASKEEIRIGGISVVVKHRLAEGGFGFVDLVADTHTHQEFVVS
jgi:hypothetical protein